MASYIQRRKSRQSAMRLIPKAASVVAYLLWLVLPFLTFAQEDHWLDLNVRINLLETQQDYANAIALAEEALKFAEASFGEANLRVFASLETLGRLYKGSGRYQAAEQPYMRAIRVASELKGSEDPNVAVGQNNLAELYREQGRYLEAEPLYQHAVAVLDKTPGLERDLATSLNDLGLLYEELGRYPDAELRLKLALAMQRKVLGDDNSLVARLTNNLGVVYKDEGRYAEAESQYRAALAIEEKTSGDISYILDNLGTLYEIQGKNTEADQFLERALDVDQKVLGEQHALVGTDLNNLATLRADQGKYGEAESLCRRAMTIHEKALGQMHVSFATDLNNLAVVYESQGKYAEAQSMWVQAATIEETVLGPTHPLLAKTLSNVAWLYSAQGKNKEAEAILQRALDIDEKSLGKDHGDVALVLNNLGGVYQTEGRFNDAEALFRRGLSIAEKRLGKETPEFVTLLNSLANSLMAQKRYVEAEPLLHEAIPIAERALGAEHLSLARVLANLADVYFAQNNHAEAAPLWDRSLQITQDQFDHEFTYMNEKGRLSLLGTAAGTIAGYSSFWFTSREHEPAAMGKMYDLALWQKGLVANSMASVRARIAETGDNEALLLLDRLAEQKARLAGLHTPPSGNVQQWRQSVASLQEHIDDMEAALARSQSLAEENKLKHVSWQEVCRALQPGEVAIEFFRFHYVREVTQPYYYYVAMLLTHETTAAPSLVPLGTADDLEGEPLRDYQSRIAKVPVRGSGIGLYRAFWKPLEPYLINAKRVYVALDGVLNKVSLAVVPDESGVLLIEKYDLEVVLSTKDLLRKHRSAKQNTAVLIGNPKFDAGASRDVPSQRSGEGSPKTADLSSQSLARAVPPPSACRDLRPGGVLCPLPGTELEVNNIFSQLKQANWQAESPYTREKATKLVMMQARHPRLLHVATHAFFKKEEEQSLVLEDPMLRSGLFFAGADRVLKGLASSDADSGSGVLTAYEATSLHLAGTELVVLSACETGQGEVRNGEGVFGLRRALQEAGAESVLMSMWPVPDKETEKLMTTFYEKWLRGEDKHRALHEAQLELRERVKDSNEGKDIPYYWGAFVLVGH